MATTETGWRAPYESNTGKTWPAAASSALRVTFGIVWAIDASFKWDASFASHFVGYLQNAAQSQPSWLDWWFNFWINLVSPQPDLFAWIVRIIETVIAAALLLGFGRKTLYVGGIIFSLLVWSTAEGFGGPYTAGATDIGSAIVYVLLFIALIVIDRDEGRSPYSVDYYIERRWPGWTALSEWAGRSEAAAAPPRLPWWQQFLAILGILIAIAVLVFGVQTSQGVKPPTPANAAAAVTPLQLMSSNPVAKARDATLPPLLGTGNTVNLNLTATDAKVEIASGVYYNAWTFGATAPGPTIHVRQGQTVNVTFTNHGTMQHSLDLHAAQVAPSVAFREVDPGQTIHWSFVAEVPGAFLYHCGTPPTLVHIGNGMYGAIIVDPKTPLPPAAASYVIVQSEWYTQQVSGNTMEGNVDKMLNDTPDLIVFNGVYGQYVDHPLPAKVGQLVRLYFVDAGPNDWSSFHMIGGMFSKVYASGDPSQALNDVSAYTVGPGDGVILDITFPEAGKYTFVDHSMAHVQMGAAGVFEVTK